MNQLLAATCPRCGRGLRIPSQWTNSLVRCKNCRQIVRTGRTPVVAASPQPAAPAKSADAPLAANGPQAPPVPNPAPIVANGPASPPEPAVPARPNEAPSSPPQVSAAANPSDAAPATNGPAGALQSLCPVQAAPEGNPANPFAFPAGGGPANAFDAQGEGAVGPNPYLAQIRKRRRRRRLITALVCFGVLIAIGVAVQNDAHVWAINQFRQWRDKTQAAVGGSPPPRDVPPAETALADSKGTAATVPTAPMAPKTARYWGRALLVGVKNYLYVNPLNPGYRTNKDMAAVRDPLGLAGLRQVLIKTMGFPAEQVVEFSDVAGQKAFPPMKSAIMENVENFLVGCRPSDRVVLAMVCHVVEAEGKNYFVPLEGEPGKVDTLIPVDWLYEQLAKCASKHKLVILDLSPFDPEQGSLRHATGPLSPKLEQQLQKAPPDTLVWLSCSGGERSYQFASNGFPGSVFMHFLQDCGMNLVDKKKNRRWNLPKDAPAGSMPLIANIPAINEEITKYVKERGDAKQTPKVFGSDTPDPDPAPTDPPPPITLQPPKGVDAFADAKLMEGIYQELSMVEDSSQAIGAESMPPFWAKNMDPYGADYSSAAEFDKKLATSPLRKATVETARLLRKHTTSFRTTFRASANDASFKKMLEREQETPATIDFDLNPALEQMEKAAKERDKEPSKRWQAHFDFVYARLLERLAYSREYNFVLGNRLRKDSPVLKDAKNNNGWRIVPADRVQDKEAKAHAAKRQKILDRIVKEYPNTPWEVLARKDLSTNLGLTVQEAKVE